MAETASVSNRLASKLSSLGDWLESPEIVVLRALFYLFVRLFWASALIAVIALVIGGPIVGIWRFADISSAEITRILSDAKVVPALFVQAGPVVAGLCVIACCALNIFEIVHIRRRTLGIVVNWNGAVSRYLLWLSLVLPVAAGAVAGAVAGGGGSKYGPIIVIGVCLIDMIAVGITRSMRAMEITLGLYGPDGPRRYLFEQQFGTRQLVRGGQALAITRCLIRATVHGAFLCPLVILGRIVRLSEEGFGFVCRYTGCRRLFEDPTLRCQMRGCRDTQIKTWPTLGRPIFSICPACRMPHPTWSTVERAIAAGRVWFQQPMCPGHCRNFGPDRRPIRSVGIIFCSQFASVDPVVELLESIGSENLNTEFRSTMGRLRLMRESNRTLRIRPIERWGDVAAGHFSHHVEVSLAFPNGPPIWVGDFSAVLLVPDDAASEAEWRADIDYLLSKIEIPPAMISRVEATLEAMKFPRHYVLRRLFLKPRGTTSNSFPYGMPPAISAYGQYDESEISHRGKSILIVESGANVTATMIGA